MIKYIIPLISEIAGSLKLKGDAAKKKANQYILIGVASTVLMMLLALVLVTNKAIWLAQEYKIMKEQIETLSQCKKADNDGVSFDSGNGLDAKHHWDKITSEVISCKDASCINKYLKD